MELVQFMTGFMILINDKSRNSIYYMHLLFQMIEQSPPDPNSRTKIASLVKDMKSLMPKEGSGTIWKAPIITTTTLNISNLTTKYRLKYGSQFSNMLEPRDIVMEHKFNFNLVLELSKIYKEQEYVLIQSEEGKIILKEIREFLVQAVSNIVSAGFKNLTEKKLDGRESYEYAAKNIMLNIHSICKQTVQALVRLQEEKPIFRERINIEEFREDLVIEVDQILHEIFINLADSYPQAPVSGGTLRMRDAITEVNRVEDEENDLIFTSNIQISDYLEKSKQPAWPQLKGPRADGDYTQFIMRVINAAIKGPQDNTDDQRERTVYQKFTEFNEHICYLSQKEEYQNLLSTINKDQNKIKAEFICRQFNFILSNTTKQKAESVIKDGKKELEGDFKKEKQDQNINLVDKDKQQGISVEQQLRGVKSLWAKATDGVILIKNSQKFSLGQKIPAAVRPFSRHEIASQQFQARHSSIVRILTKWTGYLEENFQNAKKMVRQRKYPFKDINNKLINLNQQDQRGVERLIKQLGKEYEEVKRKFQDILRKAYKAMGKFISDASPKDFLSSVQRYSETRTASSKINTVLATLLMQYANILIHHLLLAGQDIRSNQYIHGSWRHNLNLVMFRVSDLMRSKLQCSESSFIAMLKTMDLLENSEAMEGKFKLVRVKNKLDDPANNIMVNYLFMGKVQCQLQLSTQEPKLKEKNYYTYSHFVYELTRGMFGAVAGCATMISQLDPMISASKDTYYQEKKRTGRPMLQKMKRDESNIAEGKGGEGMVGNGIEEPFFECFNCKRLITKQHTDRLFLQTRNTKKCFHCIISDDKLIQSLLKPQLKERLRDIESQPIKNYRPLDKLSKEKYLISLRETGEIALSVIVYDKEEMRTFSIALNLRALLKPEKDGFGSSLLDYIDVSESIRDSIHASKETVSLFGYLFDSLETIPEKVFGLLDIKKQQTLNVPQFLKEFKEFRHEKRVVKTIRSKAEIIKIRGSEERQALDRVCRALVERDKGVELKYNRNRQLDLSNIKNINMLNEKLLTIPGWLTNCFNNLRVLQIQSKIKAITSKQIPQSIHQLKVTGNCLEEIDISTIRNLTLLDINRNQLTYFDLGDNNSLTNLQLDYNQLTSFDLRENNSLTQLCLQQNQLTSFDLRENKSLTQLSLSDNKLTSFDLRENNSLTILHLRNNQLTSFDLRENNSLTQLYLRDNKLTSFDLRENNSLTRLDLRDNKLTSFDLRENNSLTQLYLQNNQLTSFDLRENNSLTRLDLRDNQLTSFDLRENNSLTRLDLRDNQLTSFDLRENNSLTKLNLGNNQLNSFQIGSNSVLIELYLSNNQLTHFDVGSNNSLKILQINCNKLKSFDVGKNNSLEQLWVSDNDLHQVNLRNNSTIQILGLEQNPNLPHLSNLPPSIITLEAEKRMIINYDFELLPQLQTLNIFWKEEELEETKREELKNLKEEVELNDSEFDVPDSEFDVPQDS